jgi:hypothetical protein
VNDYRGVHVKNMFCNGRRKNHTRRGHLRPYYSTGNRTPAATKPVRPVFKPV